MKVRTPHKIKAAEHMDARMPHLSMEKSPSSSCGRYESRSTCVNSNKALGGRFRQKTKVRADDSDSAQRQRMIIRRNYLIHPTRKCRMCPFF
jgi:hypothetical protein